MPANLPPHYFEVEKRYREAKTADAKIQALEEMLTIMPKHKGTDKLRADLRRRIAKHKAQSQQQKGGGRRDFAHVIDKDGAAQVVVIGPPNSGKSSLIAKLTNAEPEIGDFPHTTWKPTPGMAPFQNIQFQLIDTPPITRDYLDPWMADLLRRADILVLLLDLHADPFQQAEDSLAILKDLRIVPEGQPLPKDLIKQPFVKKMLLVLNKMDNPRDEEDFEVFVELSETPLPCMGISIHKGKNLHMFLEFLYQAAGILRVYTKAPGKEPDRKAPFVLPRDSTLEDLAAKIHKDFVEKLKFAKIWGTAVHDGQMVQRDYLLQEGDVVEIHL